MGQTNSRLCQISNSSWTNRRYIGKFFINFEMAANDPILGVSEACRKDPNPRKVNLGVGAYRCDDGKPAVLKAVREAEQRIVDEKMDKEYPTIAGLPEFLPLATELVFGGDSRVVRDHLVYTAQTISGTGALRVGADFIERWMKTKHIYLPEPTWGNHVPVFEYSDLIISRYRYYDRSTCGFDEAGAIEDIMNMEERSVILFHACAHNPTGVDPTKEQWQKISDAVRIRQLLPFFDMAYLGFATGDINEDAYALRLFIEEGHQMLVAQSFSKNMGLYGERIGSFSIVCNDPENTDRVGSQVRLLIRALYSLPPIHGARIATRILSDPELKQMWLDELKTMAGRISLMRHRLRDELVKRGSRRNWDHITNQIGMFCFTGLNEEQVKLLAAKYSIYMTLDGRISIAGINTNNVEYLADAMHEVTK